MKIKMTFVCTGEESGVKNTTFTAEGKSFFHTLGLIDEQICSIFGNGLYENEEAEELIALFACYKKGEIEYNRDDFSTPESNWKLSWEVTE